MRESGWSRGFTVVEILVVLGIVLVLAAVALPLAAKIRSEAQRSHCMNNLRAIGVGLEGYLGDHNGRYPELAMGRDWRAAEEPVLETVLVEYVGSPDAFHCPADHEHFVRTGSSYLWNSTQSGRHRMQTSFLGMESRPERVPLVLDKEPFHGKADGVNMLYADYHLSRKVEFRVSPK